MFSRPPLFSICVAKNEGRLNGESLMTESTVTRMICGVMYPAKTEIAMVSSASTKLWRSPFVKE